MKRNKKKAVLVVLMIALLLLGAVGGTVAYLMMQTGTVENVFQPAQVPSEVEETFSNNVKRDVKIRNNGNVNAYIRAAIIVTWKDANGNIYPGKPEKELDYIISIGSYWDEGSDGFYYYNEKVPAGATTKNLINSCSPKEDRAPEGYSLNVEILGQAIQAEGITGATSALNAWEKAAQNGSTGN